MRFHDLPAAERQASIQQRLASLSPAAEDEDLVQLIDHMTGLRPVLGETRFMPLRVELAARLELPLGRIDELLKLSRKLDIRRALRYRPVGGSQRLPEEEIYPTTGWLGEYLEHSLGDEAPLGFHFWAGLGVLGAACRRNVYIDMNKFEIYPNIYAILVGEPATKKSQALDQARAILRRANHLMTLDPDIPIFEHFNILPNKCTPEYVLQALKCDGLANERDGLLKLTRTESHGVWLPDELVILFGKSTYNASGHIELLTDFHSCPDEPGVGTVARGKESLFNVSLTFLGGSTPNWMRTGITEEMFQGGFVSRCSFVWRDRPKRLFPVPDVPDPVRRDRLAAQLIPLILERDRCVGGTKDFWDYHYEWYLQDHEATAHVIDDHERAYRARRQIHALKITMLLAISDNRWVMDTKDLQLAVKIIENEQKGVREVLGQVGGHDDMLLGDYVVAALRKRGGVLSRSKLYEATKHKFGNMGNLNRITESLRAEGVLGIKRNEKNSAQTDYFLVRPKEVSEPQFMVTEDET